VFCPPSVNVDYIDLPWGGFGYCPDWTHYALAVPTSQMSPDEGCPGGCKYYDHANCDPTDPVTFGGKNCWIKAYPGEGTGDQVRGRFLRVGRLESVCCFCCSEAPVAESWVGFRFFFYNSGGETK
jgi:hypothetical protein